MQFVQSNVLIALIHALDIGRAMLAGLKISISCIWELDDELWSSVNTS
jgi:hypothetical protein